MASDPHRQQEPTPSTVLHDPSGRTFELVQLLGAGGFGEVFLARMRSAGGLDQHVAVKLLHKGLRPENQAVERLRDEARLLTSLRHPVVLAAHNLLELDGRVALVTEFIEGQDLSACLEGSGAMPPSTQLEVVEHVASALDVAWKQLRVVHRDVKPANIRIGVHGNVKLLDFGIARSAMTDRAALTASHMLVGTLRYIAPERFHLAHAPQPASDVFSLGCVLYEGVTGRSFFGKLGTSEVIQLGLSASDWGPFLERQLSHVDPSLGPIRSLLADMLCFDVAERPLAGDVARRCEGLLTEWSGHVPLRRWCRDHPWSGRPLPEPPPPPPRPPVDRPTTLWQRDRPTTDLEHTDSSLIGPLETPPRVAPRVRPVHYRWGRWALVTGLGLFLVVGMGSVLLVLVVLIVLAGR